MLSLVAQFPEVPFALMLALQALKIGVSADGGVRSGGIRPRTMLDRREHSISQSPDV